MHWDCFLAFPQRAALAREQFESLRHPEDDELWTVVFDDGDVSVAANADPQVARVSLALAQTGTTLEVPIAEWARWIHGPPRQSRRWRERLSSG